MQALFHTERYAAIEKKLKEQAAELEARGEKCRTQREQLLATAAGSEKDLSETTRRFIHLVVTKGRADMMQLIARSFGTLYRRERHIIEGTLTVPASLTPELTERLRSIVEKRTDCRVDFSVKEDKELLGGFVLQYDTYRLDASVKTQLQKMKRELAG